MPKNYRVAEGDCIASIAAAEGHLWKTIWMDGANTDLRRSRPDPNQLRAGDVVVIPDPRPRSASASSDSRHRFRRRGVPSRLRLRLLEEGEPIADEPFRADVDGTVIDGTTDSDGYLQISIPSAAERCLLQVGSTGNLRSYEIDLGHLDPISSIRGVKQRLSNMGHEVGELDDGLNDLFKEALAVFQAEQELESTGELNEPTRQKLEAVFGR